MRYCILFTFFPYSHFSFICGFVYAKANRAHTVCSGWESKESKEIALGDSAQWGGGAHAMQGNTHFTGYGGLTVLG